MKIMKKLTALALAMFVGLSMPANAANAAEITFDTEYGQMTVTEDGYANYLMWKQDTGHYLVFYNGEITCDALTESVATLSFPDTVRVYDSASDYVGVTQTSATYDVKYTALDFYAANKAFTYTDGTNTVILNEQEYALAGTGTYFAGTTEVAVDIEATIINITVPLNVNCVINVNEEDALVHGDIVIENHTKAPVKISLSQLSSTDLPFTNLIRPNELPTELEWDMLNASDSMKYFSFGMKAIDTENTPWKSKVADYTWAVPNFTESELGVIEGESDSNLGLDARFGRTITHNESFTFHAVFVAELE